MKGLTHHWQTMIALVCFIWSVLAATFKSQSRLQAENAAIRHQSQAARYLIRDRDGIYDTTVSRRLRAMGTQDKAIAPGSPWQNGYAERLIGMIRRECVDHLIVFGEAYLRRIVRKYAAYCNGLRPIGL